MSDFTASLLAPNCLLPYASWKNIYCIAVLYSFAQFLFLMSIFSQRERFVATASFGGYFEKPIFLLDTTLYKNLIMILWVLSALAIGYPDPAVQLVSLVINFCFTRYFFIATRWTSLSRGFGAPGFVSNWLGGALLVTYIAGYCGVEKLAILVLQVDFALIMLSAGIYKALAGYAHNEGMEYGMANPAWGYWYQFFRRVSPSSAMFKVLDFFAWSLEIVGAICMLIPSARYIGGLTILLSFVFVATQIRLNMLCLMVISSCLFFVPHEILPLTFLSIIEPQGNSIFLSKIVEFLLVSYLLLIPAIHAGLSWNFYAKKSFPKGIQRSLIVLSNFFGVIVWRVFSADVTNFFIEIYRKNSDTSEISLVSDYGWKGGIRFNHVCESIVITCIFTTLKYYPDNIELFRDRLLRYARSFNLSEKETLVFKYYSIQKGLNSFEYLLCSEYEVSPNNGQIIFTSFDAGIDPSEKAMHSPIHQGRKPGSYELVK